MSKNLSINKTSLYDLIPFYRAFALPILSFVSVLVHLYAILIFIQMIRTIKQKGQMFKYFLAGSINNLLLYAIETIK